jgi:tRNA 2-thiouridine synthesizing protein A
MVAKRTDKGVTMAMIRPDLEIDVKGMECPRPLLKTKQALEGMQSGQILKVVSTDATTRMTFPPFLNKSGDELLLTEEEGGILRHFIKKK